PAGKKIRISQKIFEGIGGFGAFYRINLPGDAYAFIADVDVAPELTSNNKSHVGQSQEKNPAFRSPAEEAPQQLPIFFTRYLGASFGFANFSEKFSGKVLNSSEWMVGFRSSGPGSLVEGLPLDASLLFHSGAPTYYTDGMTNTSASGFFVIGEVYLPIPLMATDAFLISTGLGMMATYTRFSVQIKETLFDSQEVRAGVAGQLGLTTRIGRFALRLDARYFYEKEAYTGYFATLMSRY
ncbi:MAG: hypothetical protein KDD35_13165, partial [Bdellovibrionales bacterium]|nr:hypothetical protein [Bdellovibrionales bacterium]